MLDAIKKREIKKKLKPNCKYCGCNNKLYLTLDHIIPLSRGGTDDESNLQHVCWLCNQLKGSLLESEFYEYLTALETLQKLYKISIVWPSGISLQFKPSHYPEFPVDFNLKKKVKKDEGDNVS